jgi:hypothetical protein
MTVHRLEKEGTQPRRATLDVILRALEAARVEFIDKNGGGPGVRLLKSNDAKLTGYWKSCFGSLF